MSEADIAALRQAVLEDRYLITLHAQGRMGLRKITHANLKHVVTTGDVVEQYPDNRPDPKALFMAHVEGEPLYVSCAFDGNCAHIVTVHRYDPMKWVDPRFMSTPGPEGRSKYESDSLRAVRRDAGE